MQQPPDRDDNDHPQNRLAPFNPTSDEVQGMILDMLAPLGSDDVLFDLGCGDGRFLVRAARRFKGLRCVGIEYDKVFATRAQESVRNVSAADDDGGGHDDSTNLRHRIHIRHGDCLDLSTTANEHTSVDGDEQLQLPPSPDSTTATAEAGSLCRDLTLADATCIYVYLLPQGIERVKPILEDVVAKKRSKNKRDLRIVTYLFSVKGWEPTHVDRTSKSSSPLYLYHFRDGKLL